VGLLGGFRGRCIITGDGSNIGGNRLLHYSHQWDCSAKSPTKRRFQQALPACKL
jgi:ribosomal protein L28